MSDANDRRVVTFVRERAGLLGAFLLGACFTASGPSAAGDGVAKDPPAKIAKADATVEAKGDAKADTKGDAKSSTPAPSVPPPEASVVGLDAVEHRKAPKGVADIWMLARGQNAFLGKLELAAGGAVPEHRDPTEEYLHVLEGGGTLKIDDVEYTLEAGSTVFMPANAKVSYQNGDARLVAIQVFAGPGPAAKYDSWKPVGKKPAR